MSDAAVFAALAAVQDYCGWHVAPSMDQTLTLDGLGSATLILPSLYVTAVDEVTSLGTVVDSDTYDWSEAGMISLRCGCWPQRWRAITVTLTHGYPEMPLSVQQVIDRLADRADADTGALARVGQVQYAVSLATGTSLGGALSTFDRAALAPYRLPFRP